MNNTCADTSAHEAEVKRHASLTKDHAENSSQKAKVEQGQQLRRLHRGAAAAGGPRKTGTGAANDGGKKENGKENQSSASSTSLQVGE